MREELRSRGYEARDRSSADRQRTLTAAVGQSS